MKASGKLFLFRYTIVISDDREHPYIMRFEGSRDRVEEAESFFRRFLRMEGTYETLIEIAEGELLTVEGWIGEKIGDPLYEYACVRCGECEWYDAPQKRANKYLCNECRDLTLSLASFTRQALSN